MANITNPDGTQIELTPEEFMLYLQAKMNFAPSTIDVPGPPPVAEGLTVRQRLEARAGVVGTVIKTAEAQEAEALVLQAAEEEVRKHTPVEMPEVLSPTVKPLLDVPDYLPVTSVEHALIQVMLASNRDLRSDEIAAEVPWGGKKVSSHLSRLFQTKRGLIRGVHSTWQLLPWVRVVPFKVVTQPSKHWPPKKGIPS